MLARTLTGGDACRRWRGRACFVAAAVRARAWVNPDEESGVHGNQVSWRELSE